MPIASAVSGQPFPAGHASAGSAVATAHRLLSLDVFRGLTMIWMISNGFGLRFFPSHPIAGPIGRQFTHAAWQGMNTWDLVQPFFMFIVGVAMPFAFERHRQDGITWTAGWPRVLRRSLMLLLCSTILFVWQYRRLGIGAVGVLGQIAFTYPAAYLAINSGWTAQLAAALGALAVHTALFASAPGGWQPDVNFGAELDFRVWGGRWQGSYATINCLSSAANTILGVMAGWLLLSNRPGNRKIGLLAAGAAAAFGAALLLETMAGVPVIKRIWTSSFALYSSGAALLALAVVYWLVDVRRVGGHNSIAAMVGVNSIFIYMFHEIVYPVSQRAAVALVGRAGVETAVPRMLWELTFIALQIAICWTLYRKRVFFKL